MLKAVVNLPGGRGQAMLLGLTPENWARLMDDQPIPVQAAQLGFPPLFVILTAGATTEAILESIQAAELDVERVSAELPAGLRAEVIDAVAEVWPGDQARRIAAATLDTAWRAATGERPVARFICPRCWMASANPNDVREGYCGACHAFTGAAADQPTRSQHAEPC